MKLDRVVRLRVTLSLWYAGVFTAILVGFGGVTYGAVAYAMLHSVDGLNRVALAGVLESVRVRGGQIVVDRAIFGHEVAEVRTAYHVRLVRILAADGRILAEAGAAERPEATGPERTSIRLGGEDVRLLRHPLSDAGRVVGQVLVARPLVERDEALGFLAGALAIAIPGAVAATLLAGSWLAGKALRPLGEAFERQRRFLADASHELRTPLAVIRARAEVGRQGTGDEAAEAFSIIDRTAAQMGRLVADLLLLTRADADALVLDRHHFFLDELAEEVTADLMPLAARRGLALRCDVEAPDLAVDADPERVRQVLTVLLDNALAYSPAPGAVAVLVRRAAAGGMAEVAVIDAGPGINAEALPRLFDRFARGPAAASAHAEGTGLGLSIARAIARAHGGDVLAVSTPGRGSEFCLSLPVAEAARPS